MNHSKCLWHLSARRPETKPISAGPLSAPELPLSPQMGPRADTWPPPRIAGTEEDKHTLTAADLICFNLRQKTRRIKEKQREVGEVGEPFFSQMKWKAHVAAISQTEQRFNVGSDYWGIFFSVLPLKLHSGRKGDVGVVVVGGRGIGWARRICRKRAHNFTNCYIYDAKPAPLLQVHSPLFKDN